MNKLIVSSSPHIKTKNDTPRLMLDVIIALLPAVVAGAIFYGFGALLVTAICVVTCVVTEFLFNLATKKAQTIFDLSAIITGLILGLSLYSAAPIWQCIVASVFAIAIVKCVFGGLGCNFANPAVTARVLVIICFAEKLKELKANNPDLITSAIGGASLIALALGYVYLVVRGVIKFETPIIMIGTAFLLYFLVCGDANEALTQILGGGLIFGAIFMANDYVTTPITRSGKMIFAFGCGLLTFLLGHYGKNNDSVYFAILFMNILTPYIEELTKPKALVKRGNK